MAPHATHPRNRARERPRDPSRGRRSQSAGAAFGGVPALRPPGRRWTDERPRHRRGSRRGGSCGKEGSVWRRKGSEVGREEGERTMGECGRRGGREDDCRWKKMARSTKTETRQGAAVAVVQFGERKRDCMWGKVDAGRGRIEGITRTKPRELQGR